MMDREKTLLSLETGYCSVIASTTASYFALIMGWFTNSTSLKQNPHLRTAKSVGNVSLPDLFLAKSKFASLDSLIIKVKDFLFREDLSFSIL